MNNIQQSLKQTQDYFGIKGNHLAEVAGISPQHWSEYRRGKADIVSSKVWEVISAMELIHPGALRHFCSLLINSSSSGDDLKRFIQNASDEDLEEAFKLIGEKMFRKSTDVLANKERLKSPIPL